MSQIVVNHENEKPVKIKNEPRRNFEGKRLFVHRIQYETCPGDFFKSQNRKANILAETFEEARQMLHASMNGADYNISNSCDSELEIHAISPVLMKEIWKSWNRKFDPDSKKLRG